MPTTLDGRAEYRGLRGGARNEELLAKFERITLWPMMGLAVISLVTLIISWTLHLSEGMTNSLETFDWLIWAIFSIELLIRLYISPKRLSFLWHNPIDVAVVLVPTLQGLRALRLARFARIFRLARVGEMGKRAVKEEKGILNPSNAMFSVLITLFVISLAAIMAWSVERDAVGSSIKSIPDAFWWAITTVTTVGYGDKYPVSPEGKAVAVVLMFLGVALFGTIAATLATLFAKSDTRQEDALLTRIANLESKIDELVVATAVRTVDPRGVAGRTEPGMELVSRGNRAALLDSSGQPFDAAREAT